MRIWILVFALIGSCLVAFAAYQNLTVRIPVEVKEPIEILSYPPNISLFPGETKQFNVTIMNHASVNYSVSLMFSLDNLEYEANYTNFSDINYIVTTGEQQLTAWLAVIHDAPPANLTLTVELGRIGPP